MAELLQVQTEIEKPGTVMVEAMLPDDMVEMRDRQMVGFFVRRRRAGDRFMIARWEEFSPRWMRFAQTPPAEWVEKINAREKALNTGRVVHVGAAPKREESASLEQMSLGQVQSQGATATINHATGRIQRNK